jgi:hypothetical protein
MVRWIMLLPGGDRAAGMEQMFRARDTGRLVRSEVDYQLHIIDVWYEKQPARALELLGRLRSRHPHNPHFSQAMADIQDFYLDDTAASLRTWTTLLEAAERGQVAESPLAQANARRDSPSGRPPHPWMTAQFAALRQAIGHLSIQATAIAKSLN